MRAVSIAVQGAAGNALAGPLSATMPTSSPLQGWKARGVALGLGLVVAPLAVEIGYRATRAEALGPTTNPRYVEHDARLGWRYRPNARERHRAAEFDVEITTNSRGFRGTEWSLESPKERPRVLVLGDSFTFGWGVRDDETFSAGLARARPRWNVLNAGVSGYGTDQELLLLEDLLPSVAPDVVVVVFCENDRFENALDVVYGKSKPRFVRRGEALELTGVPVEESWLERTSQVWRAFQKARWERGFADLPRDAADEWRLLGDLYRAMKRRLGGTPLVVASTEARLVELPSVIEGVVHVDLRAAFDGRDAARIAYPIDGHWTPAGHALVAEELAKALDRVLGEAR